jgi:hypothetical protein|tara:strand:+ start:309 stop:965 length:657 start_codon:yes stop_codon:yes gene_type:complete
MEKTLNNEDKVKFRNIEDLKPHPRNYKTHPEDQIQHICRSIEENGVYRNIVIAKDNTILAGHGVVEACRKLKLKSIPVIELPIKSTSPKAIKLLASDNEVSHLGETNERQLSEILKEIMEDGDLLGTGYDEMMLANLAYVTRPRDEIKDFDEAKEWLGMPEFENTEKYPNITIHFRTMENKLAFQKEIGLEITEKTKSVWWPKEERDDLKSVKYEQEK